MGGWMNVEWAVLWSVLWSVTIHPFACGCLAVAGSQLPNRLQPRPGGSVEPSLIAFRRQGEPQAPIGEHNLHAGLALSKGTR